MAACQGIHVVPHYRVESNPGNGGRVPPKTPGGGGVCLFVLGGLGVSSTLGGASVYTASLHLCASTNKHVKGKHHPIWWSGGRWGAPGRGGKWRQTKEGKNEEQQSQQTGVITGLFSLNLRCSVKCVWRFLFGSKMVILSFLEVPPHATRDSNNCTWPIAKSRG